MAKEILAGSTNQTIDVFVQDSSATNGDGLTGLVFNSAGLTCYYRKGATGAATQLTLATQTVGGAHSDGGFVQIDATNMPGLYRLDLSDTMLDTAGVLKIYLRGATNMAPTPVEVEIVSVDKYNSVRMGLTALPNAAADAAGGLPISDAGGLDLDTILDAAISTRATASALSTVDSNVDAILIDTAEIGTAGAGLTAIPWNSAWDAEVQSEVTDALNAYDGPTNAEMTAAFTEIKGATWSSLTDTLEEIRDNVGGGGGDGSGFTAIPWNPAWDAEVQSEVTDALNAYDGPTNAEMVSAFTEIKGATWSSVTDTLEAIRDRGDSAWLTATGFSTLSQADVRSAVGMSSANLDTQLSSIQTTADNVETDTQDIQSRLPSALVSGRMDSNLSAISDSTVGVAGFERATSGIVRGTVDTGASITSIPTSSLTPAASVDDQFIGLILKFDQDTATAALRGQATDITDSTSGGTLTVTALTTAPSSGDTFTIS